MGKKKKKSRQLSSRSRDGERPEVTKMKFRGKSQVIQEGMYKKKNDRCS